jgi:predicted nucleic acid-binding protein
VYSIAAAVVDASVVLEMVLGAARAEDLLDRLFSDEVFCHAPHFIDLEVLSILRRTVLSGEANEQRAARAVHAFATFPIERHAHESYIARIWALRHNFTSYDASYVALAEALDAPLITCDAPLARAAAKFVDVEIVR